MAAPVESGVTSTDGEKHGDKSFLPNHKSVNDFSQSTLKAVLEATRASHQLPTIGDDYDYYSSFEGFRDILDVQGRRILHMMHAVLKQQNVKGNLSESSHAVEIEDKFDVLIDANDQILEKVGNCLDEASGLKKNETPLVITSAITPKQSPSASWNKKASASSSPSYRLFAAKHIQRPQMKFKDKIDNTNRPFIPRIKHKPNAKISLEESLKIQDPDDLENPDFVFPHPYQYELDDFKPDESLLERVTPQDPLPVEETPIQFIDKVSKLHKLCDLLKSEKEFAVDLEHHSYRTFQGLTCLMQISTRRKDFIIDTLELRSDLHLINEAFTDPNIVKVFHGSDCDIDWLQRDLGIYVVNMFDTGQAARVLNCSRFSLSYLLKLYCQVDADKQYQLADWRIRPLPEELIKYAREDTHFLLYIYDLMKNELIEKGNAQNNLLLSVIQRSTQICSKVYKKFQYTEDSFMDLYRKSRKVLNSQQLQAFKSIYAWRDSVARKEDESTGYVLPNHMMLQIAEILPREAQGIIACCNPVPPLVRQSLGELHGLIMAAREVTLIKGKDNKTRKQPSQLLHPKYDADSLLNCPHDTSHQSAEKTDLPTIYSNPDHSLMKTSSSLFNTVRTDAVSHLLKDKPSLKAFSWTDKIKRHMSNSERKALQIKSSFVSPFDKYFSSVVEHSLIQPSRLNSSSTEINMVVQTWKLKSHTPLKRKTVEMTEESAPSQFELARKRQKVEMRPSQVPVKSLRDKGIQKKHKKSKISMNVSVTAEPTVSDLSSVNFKGQNVEDLKKKKKKKKIKNIIDPEGSFMSADSSEQGASKNSQILGDDSSVSMTTVAGVSALESAGLQKGKSKKKKDRNTIDGSFEPYDYSKADMSAFRGSTSNTGANVFNPFKQSHKSGKVKKPRSNISSAQKSLTYGKKRP